MASTGPILHVSFSAVCEIPNAAGRTTKYESVGMALDNAAGLVIAVGNREKRMTTFALHAVTRVHTKFLGSGKLTFEMTNPNQSLTQVLVSKCQPDDLKALLGTLDEAAKRAKQRGVASVSQDEAVGLLQTRFPEQVKKQLAKLREAKGSDAPMPIKSHTRLMLVVDAGGMSVVQAGKALCRLAEAELKLTSHPRPGESNAQSYKAVCKDGADKTVQLELRAKECVHHRLKKALWLDLELGDKMEVSKVRTAVVALFAHGDESNTGGITQLAHGAIRERLAGGLTLHLRSGSLQACRPTDSPHGLPPPPARCLPRLRLPTADERDDRLSLSGGSAARG